MLVRQGAIYHVRRRVPDAARRILRKSEIWVSTRTSDLRVARRRGPPICVAIDRVFEEAAAMPTLEEFYAGFPKELQAVIDATMTPEQNQRLIDDYFEKEYLKLDLALEKANRRKLIGEQIRTLAEIAQDQLYIRTFLEDATRRLADMNAREARLFAELQSLRNGKAQTDRARDDLEVMRAQAEQARSEMDSRLDKVTAIAAHLSSIVTAAQPQSPVHLPGNGAPSSPLFTEEVTAFLREKQRHVKSGKPIWKPGYVAQAQVTFRLWVEFAGDRPTATYTRKDAADFRLMLLELPSWHGKLGKPATIAESIALANQTAAERVSMKTAKRHFSALSQYWQHLLAAGHVKENIFRGHSFPGTSGDQTKIMDFSAEQLEAIFRSQWFSKSMYRDRAEYWAPLIALYSGMRMEEICRLRPQDFVEKSGVLCFVLREHPDGWTPKTEAGERVVPCHPFLVELGLLKHIESQRLLRVDRIFPNLRPGGPDLRLGHKFSSNFSALKKGLGFPDTVNFHSFRHTFRTLVGSPQSREPVDELWIDRVMGHEEAKKRKLPKRWVDAVLGEKDPDASEGLRRYTKRTSVECLDDVIRAFVPPIDLSVRPGRC